MTNLVHTMICLAVLVAVPVEDCNAIVTSDALDAHVVHPGESRFGVQLEGVAMLGIAVPQNEVEFFGEVIPICTGSLITERHILTAAHCFDSGSGSEWDVPDGSVDDFFRLDPYVARFSLADETIAIEMDLETVRFPSTWPIAEDDIAIVELVEEAPVEVPRYSLLAHNRVVGEPTVIAGFGEPGYGGNGIQEELFPPSLALRAGLNRFEQLTNEEELGVEFLVYDFDSGDSKNNSLQLAGVESDLGFLVDEALAGPGDSGAPNFVNGSIAGLLTLVVQPEFGDLTDDLDSSWGELGLSLPIANYRRFVLSATEGKALFVPEPASLTFFTLALFFVPFCRKRRA